MSALPIEVGLNAPLGTFLLAYRGSIAHNMYVPGTDSKSVDDIDLLGAVIAPIEYYFGLREWGSRGTREIKSGPYDIVYYEIRKLVSLLLQGNPNVLGILWLRPEHYLTMENAGRRLVENRRLFVGKHVYNAFAGYAHAQMLKMETRDPQELQEYIWVNEQLKARGIHPNERGKVTPLPREHPQHMCDWSPEKLIQRWHSYHKKGENIGYMGEKRKRLVLEHGYDSKNAAHLIRLLRMCIEFLDTGELTVYRERDREELLDIKRGKWELERVKQLAVELFEEAKRARDRSALPNEPDRQQVETLLVQILREAMK